MPRKRTGRFANLPVPQQQDEIDRFHERKRVRDANRELSKLVLSWVMDLPPDAEMLEHEFMMLFEDAGHLGEYHQDPTDTTYGRVIKLAAMFPNILQRLRDTPLDYMGAIELSYVYERIMAITAKLKGKPRGTMADAIRMYQEVGEIIRQRVFIETGHYPEEFPIPYGKMTGKESAKQFKLRDHQPRLIS
jgi:hypothetical protein